MAGSFLQEPYATLVKSPLYSVPPTCTSKDNISSCHSVPPTSFLNPFLPRIQFSQFYRCGLPAPLLSTHITLHLAMLKYFVWMGHFTPQSSSICPIACSKLVFLPLHHQGLTHTFLSRPLTVMLNGIRPGISTCEIAVETACLPPVAILDSCYTVLKTCNIAWYTVNKA